MSEVHSTPAGASAKPAKPYPEFPLTAHPAGYWCKKIRGKLHYFGPWDDPDGALAKYLEQKDALHAGRKPVPEPGALTVKAAANAFLTHKLGLRDSGELSTRMWAEYKEMCDLLVKHFGRARLVADLDPADFAALRNKLAKRWGPVRLGNAIQRTRSVFKYALDAVLIDKPVRFGPGFTRPTKKVLRLHRAAQGPKLFTAEEVRKLLAAAGMPLKAMVLLGINCGFGTADCGQLPLSAVDLEAGIIDFPRPKTGIPRRCPLWRETVQAVRDALAVRPDPKDPADAGLVLLTPRGRSWHKESGGSYAAHQFSGLLRKVGINGRKGLGLYTLRHTFRTIADEAKDQPAADFIMGHEVPHMSTVYRETISDARLKAVTDYVRAWLFPPVKLNAPAPKQTGGANSGEEE
jgi:integrase